MPELESYTKGHEVHVLLAFHKDVGHVLSKASDYSEAIILCNVRLLAFCATTSLSSLATSMKGVLMTPFNHNFYSCRHD
jgi:hypothetical protein